RDALAVAGARWRRRRWRLLPRGRLLRRPRRLLRRRGRARLHLLDQPFGGLALRRRRVELDGLLVARQRAGAAAAEPLRLRDVEDQRGQLRQLVAALPLRERERVVLRVVRRLSLGVEALGFVGLSDRDAAREENEDDRSAHHGFLNGLIVRFLPS